MEDLNAEYFMDQALAEAEKALEMGEVPIGAVVVLNGKIVGRGYNYKETSQDVTDHAEVRAIKDANRRLGRWRLSDCDLYVTLEPCVMCSGAIIQARLRKLYIGSLDPKSGASVSLMNVVQDERLNHYVQVETGVRAEETSKLLKDFFKDLRAKKKADKKARQAQARGQAKT